MNASKLISFLLVPPSLLGAALHAIPVPYATMPTPPLPAFSMPAPVRVIYVKQTSAPHRARRAYRYQGGHYPVPPTSATLHAMLGVAGTIRVTCYDPMGRRHYWVDGTGPVTTNTTIRADICDNQAVE